MRLTNLEPTERRSSCLIASSRTSLRCAKDFSLGRLISQQIASADSICANIEEGYGRLSRQEYIRFLDFSRGSARETRGRYLRMHHWLNAQTIQERIRLLDEIIGILTGTIETLKRTRSPLTLA